MPDEQIAWDIIVDEAGEPHRFVVARDTEQEAKTAAWAEVDGGATVVSCARLNRDATKLLWPMLDRTASRILRWRQIEAS